MMNNLQIYHILYFIIIIQKCLANLPPVFTDDMNNLAISEKIPIGTVVYTLKGTDPENSKVYFNLKGTDVLKVNRNSGVVTIIKPLDREINDTLNIIVSIEDEVEGGRNNIVEVPIVVIILDENDNSPNFIDTPYEISVLENTPVDTEFFSDIKVNDKDLLGDDLEIECINLPEYQNACEFFKIKTYTSTHDWYQGSIILKMKLNYTIEKKTEFLLKAIDGELSNTTKVTVNVEDVQDTPPKFINTLYAEIYENVSINTLVFTVHAEDGDQGVPRKIIYELIDDPMNYFLLDAVTGEIRTAKPLDKEAINNTDGILKFTIRAYELIDGAKSNDPSTFSEIEGVIKILDINDEHPYFNKKEYFVEIPENLPKGSILPDLNMIIIDPDEGNNSAFSLELNDISDAFTIEPNISTGSTKALIRIANNKLDYEDLNQRKFIILAVAKELYTNEHLSSTATITITITDVNDNAPVFDKMSYTSVISEQSLPNTFVISITAKDRDSGRFGENGIIYRLSGNGNELFTINNRTGTVSVADCAHPGVKDCLDYEEKSEYLLQFIAIDDDGKGQTSIVPLKILLTDNNDNPPVFNQPIYRIFVSEGSAKFEPDLIVDATDADKTSQITYSIISGNEDNMFNIDQYSGKIRITNNKVLNINNDTNRNILLNVMASDSKFTTTTIVNITIKDINNNIPTFTEDKYEESIPEDIQIGSVITQLKAIDLDYGDNANINYFIQKGAYDDFKIDNSGIITVISKLDFDRRNTYNIEIIAKDNGDPPQTGTTQLKINIINTNDKSPYFIPTTQKTEVMENVPIGTVIHTLIALDPDVNSSDALNFAATEPITALDKYGNSVLDTDIYKKFFLVDKNSGKVSILNPLQRDIAAIIKITVLVTDTTAPTVQQGEGLLIITIMDINDSPPSFLPPWSSNEPYYHLELKEEQPIGTIVATYEAIDEDSDIAGYTINPDSEYFKINNGTGIVQIRKIIDYEETKNLNFTIVAFDSGIPQLNSTATVFVKIINLNDNGPIFPVTSYNASIYENSINGTFVIKVEASDIDDGDFGTITYKLVGEHSENFHISPNNGVITVANSKFLDHELINQTVLQVVASDTAPLNLKRSVTVPINLNIMDLNDNKPKFNQSEYNISVPENIRLNPLVPIIQINATDKDSNNYGLIHYKIIDGNKDDVFLLGIDTGILYPHKSLMGHNHDFHLTVEARDEAGNGPFFDETKIHIKIINVNEHKPIFIMPTFPNSTIEVRENAAIENYLIMTVKAIDEDEDENGKISYHLRVNNENVQETNEFKINSNSGELRSKILLSREDQFKYELILIARDHGFPKWFETICYLTIILVGSNENSPEFPNSKIINPYHFYINENNNKNIKIGQVKALDRDDSNSNSGSSKIYYYILYGNEDGGFYLDRTDGNLYANKTFDRELKNEYLLYILASNEPDFFILPTYKLNENEINLNNSIVKIIVTINDINDNLPKFDKSIYYAGINFMSNINDFITNISAYDPDNGINGSTSYFIKASNLYKYGTNISSGSIIPSPFKITDKGEINVALLLNENNQHKFVIDVIARENTNSDRETYAKVFVWIFEPEQLIRIILSRPSDEVIRERDEIVAELSNATQNLVIIEKIKHHIDDNGKINNEWSDMFILVVNQTTQTIVSVPSVLKIIDSKYDFLKDYYAGFAIENVIPAFTIENKETFDPALAALIALLIVLFFGIITFIFVCCCLRHWVISPVDSKKKDALIKRANIDDLNTTDNPLWMEQKLKIYEEQELTMHVFNEPEQNGLDRRTNSSEFVPDDNTYATIQHPNRRGSLHTMCLSMDLADYATLSAVRTDNTSNYYEAAMGFQGSTFQVPEKNNDESHTFGTTFEASELTTNYEISDFD